MPYVDFSYLKTIKSHPLNRTIRRLSVNNLNLAKSVVFPVLSIRRFIIPIPHCKLLLGSLAKSSTQGMFLSYKLFVFLHVNDVENNNNYTLSLDFMNDLFHNFRKTVFRQRWMRVITSVQFQPTLVPPSWH